MYEQDVIFILSRLQSGCAIMSRQKNTLTTRSHGFIHAGEPQADRELIRIYIKANVALVSA